MKNLMALVKRMIYHLEWLGGILLSIVIAAAMVATKDVTPV
jgi:hypothetical protein